MAQKVDIENLTPTPSPAKFSQIEAQKNAKIKPLMDTPEQVLKKAIHKTAILVVIFLLATGGLIFYAIQNTSRLVRELQKKQNLIFLANQQTEMSTELLREWKEIAPNIDKINKSLPSSKDLLGYLGTLEEISLASGVIEDVKLQTSAANQNAPVNLPGSTTGKGGSVDYTIELKGNLGQFVNYTRALEKAPYFTKITDFNITGSSSTGLNQDASATFGAKVYTYN